MHTALKIVAFGVLLALVGLGVWYVLMPKHSEAPLVPTPPPVTSVEPPNFTHRGSLVKNSPGLKPEVWYLLYNVPEQPAVSSELVFNSQSECIFASSSTLPCDVSKLENNMHVYVEGFAQHELVAVRRLEASTTAATENQ